MSNTKTIGIGILICGIYLSLQSPNSRPRALSKDETQRIGAQVGRMWVPHVDHYCEANPLCQTDGCGGAWPISQCTTHKARVKLEQYDLKCWSELASAGWNCEHSVDGATCSILEGICVVYTLNQNPLVQICAQQAASGTHWNPNECRSWLAE